MNVIIHSSVSNRDDIPVICRGTLECIEVLDGSLVDLCVIADKAVQKFVGLKRVLASSLDKCKKVVKVDVKTRCNKRKLSDNVGTQELKDKKGMSSKKNIDKEKYSGEPISEEQRSQVQIGTFKDLIENVSARKVTLATRAYDILDHAVKCIDEDTRMVEHAMKLIGYDVPTFDDIDVNILSAVGKKKELEPVYCTCRNIAHGDMISCDNEKCNIEWFHFACVGLTKLPKGDWFCKVCKVNLRNRL